MLASPAAIELSICSFQRIRALPSISIPRLPALPVSWVYSPGETLTWLSPFHFTSFSKTTLLAGILIPRAKVSVAKTIFRRPR